MPRGIRTGWVGPGTAAAGIVVALFGGWLAGALLAPGLTPDEATAILRTHLRSQATGRALAATRARGLDRPDVATLQRLSDEVIGLGSLRVARVATRPEIFWAFSRRSHCVTRMELDAPPGEARPVRYFRITCEWLLAPRIMSETTASTFRLPL